jgi:RNA polymerase sigma-70 factor (ECF subfamily)
MVGLMDQTGVAFAQGASVEELEVIYRRGFRRFVRVAEAVTRSRELAVDAVQEAFASVLVHRAEYRGAGPLEAWVWRAVVNAALRSRRERMHEQLDTRLPDADTQPADRAVRQAIGRLPERQRLVLFLRYYADLDYRSIAAALEIEIGTVGSTLNQAQNALRGQLVEARRL